MLVILLITQIEMDKQNLLNYWYFINQVSQ
jgi:hypothetical protein